MRKFKITVVFLWICCSMVTMVPQSMAETNYSFDPEAWQLHRLELYTGISSETFIPDLGAKLDRQLGVTLLLNFFGKRNEVLAMTYSEVDDILSPYTDKNLVSPWARPYMAYAVKNGIVWGTSADTLGPLKPLDGNSFATMILRRLGFKIEGNTYLVSLQTLCDKGGLNASEVALFNKQQLLKNDAVGMVYTAMYAKCSNGETLIENMVRSGIVSADMAFSQKLIRYDNLDSIEVVNSQDLIIPRPTVVDQISSMILDAMIIEAPNVKLSVTPFTDTAKEVFDLVEKCIRDNPEILYYAGCTYSSNGLLTFQYSKDLEVFQHHTALLKEKLDTILDQIILPNMSDYQKELAVHDYIINNCDYDFNNYNNGDIPSESFNAYGALCLETAVCEGYAEATKLLLNRAGVDCNIVTGSSRDEGHAWNIARINGQYYQLDVTWDDPIMTDGSQVLYYHYFNLTDNEMKVDHDWDVTEYPGCNGTEFNYYTYNKLIVPSREEFVDFVVAKVEKGSFDFTVKVQNYKSIGFDYNQAVKEACNRLKLSCTVAFNEEQGIVNLSFN